MKRPQVAQAMKPEVGQQVKLHIFESMLVGLQGTCNICGQVIGGSKRLTEKHIKGSVKELIDFAIEDLYVTLLQHPCTGKKADTEVEASVNGITGKQE